MIISLITAPVEPAPIEPEVETFRDTAEVTEVKTEGTFYTNFLLTPIALADTLFSYAIIFTLLVPLLLKVFICLLKPKI